MVILQLFALTKKKREVTGEMGKNRFCHIYRNVVGDEFHYLLVCHKEKIRNIRNKYFSKYYTVNSTRYNLKGILMFFHVEFYKNLGKVLKNCMLLPIKCWQVFSWYIMYWLFITNISLFFFSPLNTIYCVCNLFRVLSL